MNDSIRNCIAPDPNPRKPQIALPKGSVDTHVHVFDFRYPFSPERGYNPPEANLKQLSHLHRTLGIDKVVFTQPSVYGTDNTAMMDSVSILNERVQNSARAVVSCPVTISDVELEKFHSLGARGLRFNMDNAGGMSVGINDLPELAKRVAQLEWHMEFLFAGSALEELIPIFSRLPVPVSIAHFAYQTAAAGTNSKGFQDLLSLVQMENTWIKISGANRVSNTGMPPYNDLKPLANALVEANEDHILWGTDWPHPNIFDENPNDADLVDALGDWITDDALRTKILVENPASLYQF
tara:strand:+ start:35 stop:919 length:885 start_codon:yes stop_codon:yes gene_type:complete